MTTTTTVRYLILLLMFEWREVLSICPVQCVCDNVNFTVTCTDAKLVPFTLNPQIRKLYLADNQINNIQDEFTLYKSLEYLDLSQNQISNLGRSTFQQQNSLIVMKVNYNMISAINNDTFTGLKNVRVLELSGNIVARIKGFSFSNLQSLNFLDLSHNRIGEIHSEAFFGLVELKTLLLGSNKIKQVPVTSFPKIKSLHLLDLGHNPIQSIPNHAFATLSALQTLLLNGCGLSFIKRRSFRGLISLLEVQLDENSLNEVPVEAALELPSLQKLVLGGGMSMKRLKPHTFTRLSQLRHLVIQHAPNLETIETLAFSDTPLLRTISISYNKKLTTIEVGAFEHLPSLRSVTIRANALTDLDENLLPWRNLHHFDVRENSLRCDCDLLWLSDVLRYMNSSRNVSDEGGGGGDSYWAVKCFQPDYTKGRLVADLKSSDLKCSLVDKWEIILFSVVGGVAGAMFIVLVIIAVKYRREVSNYVKDNWSGRRKGSRNVQYQKTCNEDFLENSIYQAANGSMKLTPVTEL